MRARPPRRSQPPRRPAAIRAARTVAGHGPQRRRAIEYRVRPLDPVRKCGPATSVQQLLRVDERSDEGIRAHLVYFDRHGWYCEHGRNCTAVAVARHWLSDSDR
jgi:hypothetical protein